MTALQGQYVPDLGELAGIVSRLAATLEKAVRQISHSECLDQEQRSEAWAILDAIQTNSLAHRNTIKLLTDQLAGGAADA